MSTYLYFETLKNLIVLLLVSFFLYCIYAIITNVMASDDYQVDYFEEFTQGKTDIEKYKSFEGVLAISLGSKQLHAEEEDKRYYRIQCWLGVAMLIIWGLLFTIIKYKEEKG